jgi:hypothetical protein
MFKKLFFGSMFQNDLKYNFFFLIFSKNKIEFFRNAGWPAFPNASLVTNQCTP